MKMKVLQKIDGLLWIVLLLFATNPSNAADNIGVPFQLSGPKVAANPQDIRVLVMGNRILINTNDGGVFAHDISGTTIGAPFQLSGPKVAANPQDIRVLVMGNRILINTKDGGVFAHDISGTNIG